ncbi:ABC transporter permease [Actinotalea sp. K2]|uniref:ABC transporter permease n=1 Tax=Actinotalea sp. K2 TaxID=2939438 RepID=UPI0020178726|nr:ABC transporter permease [Actinotalea sp. K2]MCL3861395.1 ABC transporter permease [Actinotalea sp. K2]
MRALVAVTATELRLFSREPMTVLFVLVLPVVILYVLNGVFGGQPADPSVWEGIGAVDFYTSAYVALVAATVGVLTVPVHLAGYREQGVLRRFRASALSPVALIGAHVVVATCVATVGAVVVGCVSVVAYGALTPQDWIGVVAAHLLCAVSFAVLGALLGLVLPTARAAQGLGVLLFFVFVMLGGAGPPSEVLPDTLARVGDALPVTYGARLLRGPWLGNGVDLQAVAVISGLLVACAVLTAWRLRTDDRL